MTDPIGYAEKELGFTPWAGRNGQKGQRELFIDIGESVKRQRAGEAGVPKIFRVEAGHGVGKTFGAAMLVNWFFDSFAPSVTMTTAPTRPQVEELLWKDIKMMRPQRLPGRVYAGSPKMYKGRGHWAIGRTVSGGGGKGSERFQGQHNKYFFVVLDEAEGVPEFVFDAVRAMMTGCKVCIVLMLANPKTRASRFYKEGKRSGVKSYRLSVLNFPNVVDGAETIPHGTSRGWVCECVNDWCEVVTQHDEDNYTFTLPYDVPPRANVEGESVDAGAYGPAGTIFLPNAEFLFRVMGVAPANFAGNTFVSPGRYEAAKKRPVSALKLTDEDAKTAFIGVDAARFGDDFGTVYVRWNGVVWREAQLSKQDGLPYYQAVKTAALALWQKGVRKLHIRFDGTGGYASTAIDLLKRDVELKAKFPEYRVVEVAFGSAPRDETTYYDIVTEMYGHAAEVLKAIRLERVPETLEADLTERQYDYAYREGVPVRKLEEKRLFAKRQTPRRSPDDGDGFVLCVCPEFLFRRLSDKPAYKPTHASVSWFRKTGS